MLGKGVRRLPVGRERPLQASLVGVEGAELQKGRNASSVVLPAIPEPSAVQPGALAEDRNRFLTSAGRYKGRAQVYVRHWNRKGDGQAFVGFGVRCYIRFLNFGAKEASYNVLLRIEMDICIFSEGYTNNCSFEQRIT